MLREEGELRGLTGCLTTGGSSDARKPELCMRPRMGFQYLGNGLVNPAIEPDQGPTFQCVKKKMQKRDYKGSVSLAIISTVGHWVSVETCIKINLILYREMEVRMWVFLKHFPSNQSLSRTELVGLKSLLF